MNIGSQDASSSWGRPSTQQRFPVQSVRRPCVSWQTGGASTTLFKTWVLLCAKTLQSHDRNCPRFSKNLMIVMSALPPLAFHRTSNRSQGFNIFWSSLIFHSFQKPWRTQEKPWGTPEKPPQKSTKHRPKLVLHSRFLVRPRWSWGSAACRPPRPLGSSARPSGKWHPPGAPRTQQRSPPCRWRCRAATPCCWMDGWSFHDFPDTAHD